MSASTTSILLLGAGIVGCRGGIAVGAMFAGLGKQLSVRVLDQALLTEGHLAHRSVYSGHPGEGKAIALARRLRELGVEASGWHGNVTRWPLSMFRADLAIVGLDDEAARTAAHRRLRAARTPTLMVGLTDHVGVHCFGTGEADACYECLGQHSVPAAATPCLPLASDPASSTRALSSVESRNLLALVLPRFAVAALRGCDLGTFHSFASIADDAGDADDGAAADPLLGREPVRGRLRRAPDCDGVHSWLPDGARTIELDLDASLRSVFATVGATARLTDCRVRFDHTCRACGRAGQRGADLIRGWPARERCRCGSASVVPLGQLAEIDRVEAERLGLLDEPLDDLGMPPGSEFAARLATDDPAVRLLYCREAMFRPARTTPAERADRQPPPFPSPVPRAQEFRA